MTKARKIFFSEEKKQKTFIRWGRGSPAARAKIAKVFWFFFSKKNLFLFLLHPAFAAETCHFTGSTDYNGRAAITTTAAAHGATTRVRVAVRFEATPGLWLHLQYLYEEISEWRNGALLRLDANTRYLLAGRVVRQQWDDFRAAPDGLLAYRIEGKREAAFRRRYPGFARYWDAGAFGLDWVDDFTAAGPDRRPDLDLKRRPEGAAVQSPFALAFYWVRFLPAAARREVVFLPGFKTDKIADVPITRTATANGVAWQAALHHGYLSAAPPSGATAEIAPDGQLRSLRFELHGPAGSARGSLRLAGCTGGLGR